MALDRVYEWCSVSARATRLWTTRRNELSRANMRKIEVRWHVGGTSQKCLRYNVRNWCRARVIRNNNKFCTSDVHKRDFVGWLFYTSPTPATQPQWSRHSRRHCFFQYNFSDSLALAWNSWPPQVLQTFPIHPAIVSFWRTTWKCPAILVRIKPLRLVWCFSHCQRVDLIKCMSSGVYAHVYLHISFS